MALESGATPALMAPTEILAEQHGQNFRRWFESPGIAVEVRGRRTAKQVSAGPAESGDAALLHRHPRVAGGGFRAGEAGPSHH